MTLSKSDLEEPYNIDKYISFLGQFMWYTTKVGPGVENKARELAVHMSEAYNVDKYISCLGQLMWYTTKVGPDVEQEARELTVHISHPGPEHCNSLGRLIGYLKS